MSVFPEVVLSRALHFSTFSTALPVEARKGRAAEQLRSWLSAFNSSSQALTETLAQARGLNEHVSKQASAVANHNLDAKGLDALNQDIVASAKAIVSALHTFEEQVEGNIREDQRIIVVDSNGFQLGLVVDHVNEVLGVQEDAIEASPNVAHQEGVSLSGIAKLDDGNRLILLLAAGNLLDHNVLSKIAEGLEGVDAATATAAEETKHGGKKKEEENGQNGEELQLVTFLLGKEEYGIPIARIQEIDRLSKITQTPKAPKFVEGVTNLRGEVIPVLSTRMLFALEEKASDDHTRVIIVDLGGAKTGLVVDSVKEVLSISSSNIAPPPASISNGVDGQFISGIGKVENGKRMIVLLDVGNAWPSWCCLIYTTPIGPLVWQRSSRSRILPIPLSKARCNPCFRPRAIRRSPRNWNNFSGGARDGTYR